MAINVQKWAYAQALRAPLKPVLVALAWHADKMGVCWPGANTLADETGYSRRTVLGALARLEELGIIQALKYPKGGREPTYWRLCLNGAGDAPLAVHEVHPSGAGGASSGADSASSGAGGAPEPKEPSRTSKGKPSSKIEDPKERGARLENLDTHSCDNPQCDGGWIKVEGDGNRFTRCPRWVA